MQTKEWVIVGGSLIGGWSIAEFVEALLGIMCTAAGLLYLYLNKQPVINNQPESYVESELRPLLIETGNKLLNVVEESSRDVEALVSLQSDAIHSLTSAFNQINLLLDRQHADIHNLIFAEDKAGNKDTFGARMGQFAISTSQTLDQFVHTTISVSAASMSLVENLHVAIRALQFEDISKQKLYYHRDTIELLNFLGQALKFSPQTINTFIETLSQAVVQIESMSKTRRTPVSNKTISSGEVELF